jgi:hypothetical protein
VRASEAIDDIIERQHDRLETGVGYTVAPSAGVAESRSRRSGRVTAFGWTHSRVMMSRLLDRLL